MRAAESSTRDARDHLPPLVHTSPANASANPRGETEEGGRVRVDNRKAQPDEDDDDEEVTPRVFGWVAKDASRSPQRGSDKRNESDAPVGTASVPVRRLNNRDLDIGEVRGRAHLWCMTQTLP